MPFKYAYILPIIPSIWFPLTFMITYVIALSHNNINPIAAYISDTGTWSPESCVFGLMLNLGAAILALVCYIRYRHVSQLCEKNDFSPAVSKCNRISLWVGYVASFGVCIVANFQETNIFWIHLLGAVMAFGVGNIYLTIQCFISFRIYPALGNKCTNVARVCCTVVCQIANIVTCVFAVIAFFQFTGENITKWEKKDGGYIFHFVSVVAEWILALVTMIFFATFSKEFKTISSISGPIFTLNGNV